MEEMEEIVDSPSGWVANHIRHYVESNGARGHDWNGYPSLLLTTLGRRSGKLRRTALIYGRDGGNYVVVGSYGGRAENPMWYLNLRADPQVTLQVGADVFPAVARPATEEERPRLWRMMTEIFPTYESYQRKTSRRIPVVVIERVVEPVIESRPAG